MADGGESAGTAVWFVELANDGDVAIGLEINDEVKQQRERLLPPALFVRTRSSDILPCRPRHTDGEDVVGEVPLALVDDHAGPRAPGRAAGGVTQHPPCWEPRSTARATVEKYGPGCRDRASGVRTGSQ